MNALEDGVKALRRLFPGGSDGGPNNEQVIKKVNLLVEKVCERIEKPELAEKYRISEEFNLMVSFLSRLSILLFFRT